MIHATAIGNLARLAIMVCGFVSVPLIWQSNGIAQESERVFRAGAATSNITPPLGEMVVGGWEPIPAKLIHDELFARCIVMNDGDTSLAIVICDNVGIPRKVFDAAKAKAAQATGIPVANLLMASTHTHSATTARGESKVIQIADLTDYQQFLVSRISDCIQCAFHRLQPAQIGWGDASETSEVFNRRWFVSDPKLAANPFGGVDQVRMNPPRGSEALDRQAGPIDPEISFLSLQTPQGVPIALLANYSLHYVGGVPKGEVSADYFGYFAKYMEDQRNDAESDTPFVAILSNGTSGDVNNIDFTAKSPKRYAPYQKMREVARKVADRVESELKELEYLPWVKLSSKSETLTLKVRRPTPEMKQYFSTLTKEGSGASRHRREAIYAKRIDNLKEAPETIDIQLQTFSIGQWGIAAIPFETFAETGLEIKRRSPKNDTFIIELANGSFGYLPTPRQHRFGGYETWLGTNYVQENASELIVDTLLRQFEQSR